MPICLWHGYAPSSAQRLLNSSIYLPKCSLGQFNTMAPRNQKRKAASPAGSHGSDSKKIKTESVEPTSTSDPLRRPHTFYKESEENGIVLREFYPHEMSNERARAYNNDEIPRPIEDLYQAMSQTHPIRQKVKVKGAVVHWFKMDLRVADNTALRLASEKAKSAGVPLIALYTVSPKDWEAHLRAPVRVDFTLRSLEVLRQDLAKLDIPLHVETVDDRRAMKQRVLSLMEEWDASHLYANMEYEVDELRREANLVRLLAENGKSMEVVHDTCVVPPGKLQTGTGRQYAVYSPWYRAWLKHLSGDPELLEPMEPPHKNPASAREKFSHLFDGKIPAAPKSKQMNEEEQQRLAAMWPAGEHEARKRLDAFIKRRIDGYAAKRNFPADDGTSSISVHLAAGTLSARTAVHLAHKASGTRKLDGGSQGIQTWISEVAWRDFYKHVLVNWPYVCMNKPFKPEYSNIAWSYDMEHFAAWCEGRTGFPIVDAAMRQLRGTGWMHNRCRMIVASFLAKDFLIDWRMGERYFMENLVDGDFASNNGGWGFAASVGVDPQPYFRVFNPLLQSEKFDPNGEYIRKWIPELKGIKGKAIHDPYGRGCGVEAKKKGYPKPLVDHKGCRERALKAYKEGISKEI
ncbi:DNA photolyase phr1 [Pyricularia oryzae]